ncbi:hypothetical protein MICAF_5100002 [Microcystis aeruginosa PCC 9807]|uniref:Uncharacterized protein n=1 Tax=Microcystis aeruginosa PCC 9807 TaxID=1160283 RepID=I4HBR7_MICAE|nr:hypothetical protein MICAF_5100002 [Microcystis aeruginosa PCC 9807]
MDRIIRNETLIEKDVWRFLSSVFYLERTNQLNLLPDKDLVDLCPLIELYQVTKNHISETVEFISKARPVYINEA